MSAHPRFYIEADITPGAEMPLPADVVNHLYNVLRLREGAEITLFNGEPCEYHAEIISASKKAVTVAVGPRIDISRANPTHIHLGMCVLKREPMSSVLARVTEVGVAEITPVISERCTVSSKQIASRHTHWQRTLISACEQCGLNTIPTLNEPVSLQVWLQGPRKNERFIALPGADAAPQSSSDAIDLLVGPEGGFSPAEEAAAKDAGFTAINLGERVLRAETAPVVAITLLS